jgi:hypothetical protein
MNDSTRAAAPSDQEGEGAPSSGEHRSRSNTQPRLSFHTQLKLKKEQLENWEPFDVPRDEIDDN